MFDLDAAPKALLTIEGNPKLVKQAEKRGYLIAGLHLAPHKLAGVGNLCPYASKGCAAACLNFAGHGGINLDENDLNMVQAARIRRTRWFKREQSAFMFALGHEIEAAEQRAIRKGLKLAVRLNVLSDVLWERIAVGGHPNIMAAFPGVTFYDYTKVPQRYRAQRVGAIPNYSLTFSLSETNDEDAQDALVVGMNVAVAFNLKKGAILPERYRIGVVNAQVIDGDESDMRFLDPEPLAIGQIVGLRVKGARGKADESGFVREPFPTI